MCEDYTQDENQFTQKMLSLKYKYFGIKEIEGIWHQQMKERLTNEYTRRLRMVI
jgi:hypothetical protein